MKMIVRVLGMSIELTQFQNCSSTLLFTNKLKELFTRYEFAALFNDFQSISITISLMSPTVIVSPW